RGHHAELRRPHALAGREHDLAGLEVLAGEAAVLARLGYRARGDVHAPALLARTLLHHHRVRAFGHHRTGEDAQSFAGADAHVRWLARKTLADALQHRFAIAREIGKAHRVPVHGGIVVARHVDRRDHVGGEHAIERMANVHPLDRL